MVNIGIDIDIVSATEVASQLQLGACRYHWIQLHGLPVSYATTTFGYRLPGGQSRPETHG